MDTPNEDNAVGSCSSSCSSQKKVKQNNTEAVSLTDDIIFFDILARLPGTFLLANARFVCKSWAAIISNPQFVEAHLRHSKPGLFLQNPRYPYGACFLEIKENEGFRMTPLNPQYPGIMFNSCDGLALFMHFGTVHVVNPVTMQVIRIPNLPRGWMLLPPCAIARVPRTGNFKLFAAIVQKESEVFVTRWYVLRLGIDYSWTSICTKCGKFKLTQIYNGGDNLYWITMHEVIHLDVDKETFRTYMLPQELRRDPQYLMMGDRLSSIIFLEQGFQIHTFDAQTGKWTFYHHIGHLRLIHPTCHEVLSVHFCAWMDQELIIKPTILPSSGSLTFGYNVKTRSMKAIIDREMGSYELMLHTISLISCQSVLP